MCSGAANHRGLVPGRTRAICCGKWEVPVGSHMPGPMLPKAGAASSRRSLEGPAVFPFPDSLRYLLKEQLHLFREDPESKTSTCFPASAVCLPGTEGPTREQLCFVFIHCANLTNGLQINVYFGSIFFSSLILCTIAIPCHNGKAS